ncbi:MAG: tetratricopeptide repeat protein [Nitrospiria bacterium]
MKKGVILLGMVIGVLFAGCATSSHTVSKEKEASAHYKLGVSYLNDNATQAAFLEFQKAIEINPKDKLAHYGLGHVYYVQNRYAESLKEFERVVKIDPEYSEAYNYSGTVYEAMGDLNSALKQYQLALKNQLYQTPQYVHYNISGVYFKQEKYQEAISELQKAVHIDPGYALAYRSLGEVYLKVGDENSALKSLEESSKLFPGDPLTHFKLGEIYLKNKLYPKADIEFKKVVSLVPDSDLAKEAKKHIERR